MRRYATILTALVLMSADPPKQAPEEADVAALQGFWVLKTTEWCGMKADQDPTEDEIEKISQYRMVLAELREVPADFRQYRTTLEIKDNTFEYRCWIQPFNGGASFVDSEKGTYKLDVGRTPKLIKGIYKGSYCTYLVQGDTLKMGLHLDNDPKKLPPKFTTDKDEDVVVMTWKREKK